MNRGLSLYLDVLRFSLALIVFLGHATFRGYTGHPFIFWFTFPFAQTAVTGFFVLSGFVIAYVASGKEADPKTYAIARFARLYSVILPALALTLVLDSIGSRIDPAIYASGPSPITGNQVAKYLATLFMVHESWLFGGDMTPGTNGPFWSLGMEAAYYLVFGLFLTRRWLLASGLTVVILSAAGWLTISLFPCWLLGAALFHLTKRNTLNPWLGAFLFLGSAISISTVGWQRHGDENHAMNDLSLRYAEAVLFAVNIYAAASATRALEIVLGRASSLVRWLGGLTFALYLCHRPLLQFLTAARLDQPGTPLQQLWLFGITAAVTVAVAALSDKLRVQIKRFCRALFGRQTVVAPSSTF